MKFRELTEDEYKKFLDKHPLKNFLQTPSIAHIRKKSGCDIYYVGVEKDGKIIAGSFISAKPTHFKQKEFYAPRGLLVDYKDKETLTFFVEELKKFIKKRKGYLLKIDPYYITKQRDINGDIVEGGIDNTEGIKNLESLGFKKSPVADQVTWTFVMDLDKSEEELLKQMRSFTRRNINKGIKNKIKVRDAKYEELNLLKEILDSTCERKNFENHNLEYFQDLYNNFNKDEIKFIIAEIDTKVMLEDLKKEKEETENTIKKMKEQKSKEEKIKKHEEELEKINKQIKEIKELKEKYKDIIPASSGVFITYGDEIIYLFGGNKQEFMHFKTPYIVQWEMIKYGLKNNFKRYNFYGISGNFDKNDKDYGIYDFKKGFTGYVEELIGEYYLPINNFYYNLFNIIRKIKNKL